MRHKADLLGIAKDVEQPNRLPYDAVKPCEHWGALGHQQTFGFAEPKKPLKRRLTILAHTAEGISEALSKMLAHDDFMSFDR